MKDSELRKGIQLYLQGEAEMAIEVLDNYIKQNEDSNGQAHFYKGLAYYDIGEFTESIENLKKAIEFNPSYSQYHYRLGIAYLRMFQHNEGIRSLEEAIRLNKKNNRAKFLLGTMYFEIGEMENAMKIFSSIIKSNPFHSSAKYYYALCCYYTGKNEEALAVLKEIIDINPQFVDAYNKLIDIHLKNDEIERACYLVFKGLENGIKSLDYVVRFYDCLVRINKEEDAEKFLEELKQRVDVSFFTKIIEVLNDTKKIKKEVGYAG